MKIEHGHTRSGTLEHLSTIMLMTFLLSDGTFATSLPAEASTDVNRVAVPYLMQKGDWAAAEKIVNALLASNPEDLEALGWQNDLLEIDSWPAVYVRGKVGYKGTFWLRLRWVGFDPDEGPGDATFQLPVGGLKTTFRERVNWVDTSYGKVTHGVVIKSGTETYRILTAISRFETETMQHRIRNMQVKSLKPFVPAPSVMKSIQGKQAVEVKAALQGAIQSGRWNDADAVFQYLAKLFPKDPDLGQYRAELQVIRKWPVRSTSSYAGTLYLRKNWITFVGEDYGSDANKPQRNDSFHYPITALKEAIIIGQDEYGAQSAPGGYTSITAPGPRTINESQKPQILVRREGSAYARNVATGKDWGFELAFEGRAKSYSFYIRGKETASESSVGADVQQLLSLARAKP